MLLHPTTVQLRVFHIRLKDAGYSSILVIKAYSFGQTDLLLLAESLFTFDSINHPRGGPRRRNLLSPLTIVGETINRIGILVRSAWTNAPFQVATLCHSTMIDPNFNLDSIRTKFNGQKKAS